MHTPCTLPALSQAMRSFDVLSQVRRAHTHYGILLSLYQVSLMVLTLSHSRLSAFWPTDVRGTWVSMGDCTLGFPDACHVALPVSVLHLWKAYQEPQQVRNNVLDSFGGRQILGANEGVSHHSQSEATDCISMQNDLLCKQRHARLPCLNFLLVRRLADLMDCLHHHQARFNRRMRGFEGDKSCLFLTRVRDVQDNEHLVHGPMRWH